MHLQYLHEKQDGEDPTNMRMVFDMNSVINAICLMCAVPGYLADNLNTGVEKAQLLGTILWFTSRTSCLSARYQKEWYWVTDKLVPSLDDNDNGDSDTDPDANPSGHSPPEVAFRSSPLGPR